MVKFGTEKTATQPTYERFCVEKKKRAKTTRFWTICFACVACVVVFVLCCVLKQKKSNQVFGSKAFFVIVGKFDSLFEADSFSERVESSGGAGTVLARDSFWVVAFVYPSKKEAELVVKNLKSDSWSAAVEEISIKKPQMSNLLASQKAAINALKSGIDVLYSNAILYETKSGSDAKIYSSIVKLKKILVRLKGNLGESDKDAMIFDAVQELCECLNDFLKSSFSKEIYSSKLKALCVHSVVCFSEMISQIDK